MPRCSDRTWPGIVVQCGQRLLDGDRNAGGVGEVTQLRRLGRDQQQRFEARETPRGPLQR